MRQSLRQFAGAGRGQCGPRLATKALGARRRGGHPTFRARLTVPADQANLKRLSYKLPRSLTVDRRSRRGLCTEAQLEQTECAGARAYGRVVAFVPGLGYKGRYKGPVLLISGGDGLPRLVMVLRGPAWQPLKLVIRARTAATRAGGCRVIVPFVPDAPLSRLAFTLFAPSGR